MTSLVGSFDRIVGGDKKGLNLSHESPVSERVLNTLTSGAVSTVNQQLMNDFTQITPEALKDVLISYFNEMIAQVEEDDPIAIVEHLAEMIPSEKLAEAVGSDPESALKKAKSLFLQAKYYLENSQAKVSPSIKSKLSNIIDTLVSFIENVLLAFGVAYIFQPSTTQLEGQIKFHQISMLVGFVSMLTATLTPLLGVTIAGPVIGGSFLLIGVLSLIWPRIAPTPSHLPCGAENWTRKCHKGEFDSLAYSKGRINIIDEIANTLINSQNGQLKKHPLLIGESRVGKNETAKAFAQSLSRGDFPELKGKKIFYLNAASLCQKVDAYEGKDSLTKISEAMGRHKENIILVIDEIQAPFMCKKNAVISQKLKSMLDADGALPYVIGLTTSNELKVKISDDVAFVNRFNPIVVRSTSPEVTQEILSHSLLSKGKSVLCEKGALKMISSKTEGMPQPYYSNLVLGKCIELTSKRQQSPLAREVQELKNSKEFIASQEVLSPFAFNDKDDEKDDVTSKIEELDEQIKSLEEDLIKETSDLDHLFHKKEKISEVKAKIYHTVLKVIKVQASSMSKRDKIHLNLFILLSRFVAPTLEAHVRDQAKKLKVNVVIDKAVIETALEALNLEI